MLASHDCQIIIVTNITVTASYTIAVASSTVSVNVHKSVQPPIIISRLLGRVAVKQSYRPVVMWLMISHELLVELYM